MRYRAVDELECFRFHDARIVEQEWACGNLVWTLEALNVTTAFTGCDFETDREIERAQLTFEDARVSVDIELVEGLLRMDADEAKRFMVERLVAEGPCLSCLTQDERNRAEGNCHASGRTVRSDPGIFARRDRVGCICPGSMVSGATPGRLKKEEKAVDFPEIEAKTIVSAYYENSWFDANYTMNLYRGCSHGCIYCDSRSDCYRIDHFDTVSVKAGALRVVERDLKSKRKKGIVITGSMSDPYNPLEARLRLTRGALELLLRYGFGVAIDTKSSLVTRDIELIRAISDRTAACVSLTITTYDDELCRKIEKNVCPASERLRALEALAGAGIDCGVLLMPILPLLNDAPENVAAIARAAADAGAKWVYPGDTFGVTMRTGSREHLLMNLPPPIRRAYVERFGNDYFCPTPRNDELWAALNEVAGERGLLCAMDAIAAYMRGRFEAHADEQLRLF